MRASSFDFIRTLLADVSAIQLDDAKDYLIETRLLPVVRRAGLRTVDSIGAVMSLVSKLQLGNRCAGDSASVPAKQRFAEMGAQAAAWAPGAAALETRPLFPGRSFAWHPTAIDGCPTAALFCLFAASHTPTPVFPSGRERNDR